MKHLGGRDREDASRLEDGQRSPLERSADEAVHMAKVARRLGRPCPLPGLQWASESARVNSPVPLPLILKEEARSKQDSDNAFDDTQTLDSRASI